MLKEDKKRLLLLYGDRARLRDRRDALTLLFTRIIDLQNLPEENGCLERYRDELQKLNQTKNMIRAEMEEIMRKMTEAETEINNLERIRDGGNED